MVEGVVDGDGGVYRGGISVDEIGPVGPLLDGFERGVVEVSSTDISQAFVQITAHGYLNPVVNQERLDAAFDRVASCIGNAHGRHIKAEVNFRTE